ncbi:ATP-binding protein [Streptomyces sp. NPDC001388]|uniref:ATP-binding protein n=1 Tax=Streptomyces sp. NPDC001388 TaxID=3364568 RepID=UPI0036CAA46E
MTTTEPATGRLYPPVTAASARAHVRDLLLSRVPAPPGTVVQDVLLVVTELITNAERHGGGLTAVDVRLDDGLITLDVSDASSVAPRTTPRGHPAAPGGFGWPLIQRLGDEVAVTPSPAGKTIRVVMRTDRVAP